MTDADPENEIGDIIGPADGMIQSPGADAGGNLVTDTEEAKRGNCRRNGERYPPPTGGWLFHHARNSFRKPAEVAFIQEQRHPHERPFDRSGRLVFNYFWCCWGAVHVREFAICDLRFAIGLAQGGPAILVLQIGDRQLAIGNPSRFVLGIQCAFNMLLVIVLHVFGVRFFHRTCHRNLMRVGHFWIGIPDASEIAGARAYI